MENPADDTALLQTAGEETVGSDRWLPGREIRVSRELCEHSSSGRLSSLRSTKILQFQE